MARFIEENAERIGLPNDLLERICINIAAAVPVEEIIVFGSYARNEQRLDSDLDIFMITPAPSDVFADRSVAYKAIGEEMYSRRLNFDLLSNDRGSFDRRRSSLGALEYQVAKDGVVLYGG